MWSRTGPGTWAPASAASSDTASEIALYIALKGIDFQVLEPAELRDHVRALAARLTRAGA